MAGSSFGLSAPAGPTAVTGRPPSVTEAPLDTYALLRDQVRAPSPSTAPRSPATWSARC
jgi:hypothetical protein